MQTQCSFIRVLHVHCRAASETRGRMLVEVEQLRISNSCPGEAPATEVCVLIP